MTFTLRTLAALVFTSTIAAAAPSAPEPAPSPSITKVQRAGVHKALAQARRGALQGVFSDHKAFADRLDRAMGTSVTARPR